ncbi:hypothetical protein THIAE_09180 [Thiomicrospira aerophila AL3]|uniref:Cds6 C-terminal domain-containing protein n=1 Tax=Thiomicrospira aerophila AL3 TaxID=717772 RepID=W0DUU8_9GAMM|nr:tetratricopeptide repeat protein [Thiomicrospira aerophila]AHF02375.1 hypothetical protein THIAE_09180 [Thiomicrospira aerophila AL3]
MKSFAIKFLSIVSVAFAISPAFASLASTDEEAANRVLVIERHIIDGEFDLALSKLENDQITVFHQQYLRGWMFVKQQQYAQAKEIWLPLWELHQDKLELGNNLAAVLIALGEYDFAKRVLETSLQQDQDIASALGNLNNLYSFLAQQAYASIFRRIEATPPKATWLHLTAQTATFTPPQIVIADQSDIGPDVMRALVSWRQAWSNQQVDNYLKAYSERFIPANGQSLQDWRRARQRNVSRPSFIDVQLEDIRIMPINDQLARVEFLQNYRSNVISSRTNKVLLFENNGQDWQIIQEIVLNED